MAYGFNNTLYPGTGYGFIGGGLPDPFDASIPDGRTYVNGELAQVDIYAFDWASRKQIGYTRSDSGGEWKIEGISPEGKFFVLFRNKDYEDSNGTLLNSFVQDHVIAEIPAAPEVENGTVSGREFNDLNLYRLSSNYNICLTANAGSKTIPLTDVVIPAGMNLTAKNGKVHLWGTPLLDIPEQGVSFTLNEEPYSFTFKVNYQKRQQYAQTTLMMEFAEAPGSSSSTARHRTGTQVFPVNNTGNAIVDTVPISADITNAFAVTSGTGFFYSNITSTPSTYFQKSGTTIEFFVRPTEYPASGVMMIWGRFGGGSQNSPGVWSIFGLTPTGSLFLSSQQTGNGSRDTNTEYTIPLNQWTHILLSSDNRSGKTSLFVNGGLVSDIISFFGDNVTTNHIYLGYAPTGWTGWTTYRGYIASIAEYIGYPMQHANFIPRDTKFQERPSTEIASRFSTDLTDQAWAKWRIGAGTPSIVSNKLKIAPGQWLETPGFTMNVSGCIEFYLTPHSIGTFQSLGGLSNLENTNRFEFGINTNGKLWLSRRLTSGIGIESATTLVADTEYHVALTYERWSGLRKIYINGVLETTSAVDATDIVINANTVFSLGRTRNSMSTASAQSITANSSIRDLRVIAGTPYYYGNFTPPAVNSIQPIPSIYPAFYDPNAAVEYGTDNSLSVNLINPTHDKLFWRVRIDAVHIGSGGSMTIREFYFYERLDGSGQTTTNKWGGTATASSFLGSTNSPDKAFDNSTNGWTVNPSTLPCWIQFQHSYPVYLNSIKIYANGNFTSPRSFTVQSSNDGIAWEDEWSVVDLPQLSPNEERLFPRT